MNTNWVNLPFIDVVADETGGNLKVPQSDYQQEGRFAVVDQGKELIAGYVDDEAQLCRSDLPVIVFGDHTRCFKLIDFPFCLGADGVKVLRPRGNTDIRYLYHYLRRLELPDNGYDRHFKYLKRTEVALPPLLEQRRIAEVLDRAEALRAQRYAALIHLDMLLHAIYLSMFGDPATNPKGWVTMPLGNAMLEVYRYPTYYNIEYEEQGVPEIRGELLRENGGIIAEVDRLRFISRETSARFPRTVVAEGDLVMSVRGTIGKIGIVPHRLAGANITANLIRMAPDRSILEPTFAWHTFQTGYFKGQLESASTSTTIQTIKAPDLKGIIIPIPPLETQLEFARRVAIVGGLRAAQLASLMKLDALFASLQHRVFRGEV